MSRCIAKLTGVAIPQHDSELATTAALKLGVPVNLPLVMQDLLSGGVRRPAAEEALALGIRGRLGKAQAQVKPSKFKCHVWAIPPRRRRRRHRPAHAGHPAGSISDVLYWYYPLSR